MDFPYLDDIIKSNDITTILHSQELAQLGDFLINFLYSSVRIGYSGAMGGVHVWDVSLKDAMTNTKIRDYIGKRTKPDKVADAGEALIAYAYFTNLLSIEQMLQIIRENIIKEHLDKWIKEKLMCTKLLEKLLNTIVERAKISNCFRQL